MVDVWHGFDGRAKEMTNGRVVRREGFVSRKKKQEKSLHRSKHLRSHAGAATISVLLNMQGVCI